MIARDFKQGSTLLEYEHPLTEYEPHEEYRVLSVQDQCPQEEQDYPICLVFSESDCTAGFGYLYLHYLEEAQLL